MYGIAFLLAIGFAVYRIGRRRQPRPGTTLPRPATRAELAGDAGEAAVDAELRRVLAWLCGENFYLHRGPVLLRHAPGASYPTAEVDHLAITPFGLFVFETKNWTGHIEPASDEGFLVRVAANGDPEWRKSPLKQNYSKVVFLRGVMPGMWPIHSFGVFASVNCTLSPAIPPSLMRIADLAHQLRLCKTHYECRGQREVNVKAAWQAVLSVAEVDRGSIERHRLRVRTDPVIRMIIP
ncbi:nuclease-related domain-containing protein [Paraburkholderia metrosideri]|uniref:Nuclease-related domain-containing protein n=1 Tax=Paraburkholderia metrosideri TaxID=580937 RepID=A0ABW9E236_9BURK